MSTINKNKKGYKIILKTYTVLFFLISISFAFQNTFAQTKTWTGTTSTVWTDANWSPAGTPLSTDNIIIPAGCTHYPLIVADRTMKSLTINSGAVLNQSGGIILVDGEVVSISGVYNQSGGSFFINNKSVTLNSGGQINLSGSATFKMSRDLTTGPQQTLTINGSLSQTGGILNAKDLTIGSGGIYTYSGTALDMTGEFTNSGAVTLNASSVNVKGKITNNVSGSFNISGASVITQDDVTNYGTMSISAVIFDLYTANKKITIDSGTFTQTGGIVSTKDMELKNGGTYNQSNGEFQIFHDLKVPSGTPANTFNASGGTVRFTGAAGGGADYTGNVQFYNLIVDAGADYNMDNDNDNIKVAGDYTNNNSSLHNDKGTINFNGTSPQKISSASAPAKDKNIAKNLVVSNPTGVILQTDLGVKSSFTYNSGGYLNTNSKNFYVNGALYSGALPVELTSFSVSIIGSKIILTWATATEVNNYGFEIERQAHTSTALSVTGWEKIGFVNGNGNSNSPKSYSFDDKSVTSGKYYYRLKQIDNDGQFEYSKAVEIDLGTPKSFTVSQNYPNPFNPSTVIKYQLPSSSYVTLKIYDAIGNEITTLVNEQKASGNYEVKFDGSSLASGMYIYQLNAGEFIITKKMILMK